MHAEGDASAYLPYPIERCWSAFIDATLLPSWVPGLRRAEVVRTGPGGEALEVAFEFGATLSYTLVYEYDQATHTVSWGPRVGRRDGIMGSASFTPEGEGCRLRYGSVPATLYSPRERLKEDPQRLLDAFANWLAQARP